MNHQPFIKSLRLRNFLSYGPESEAIELLPLNVLIGTNASGKSNMLEALSLLRSLPRNFEKVISEGGGPKEWIWKGDKGKGPAEIELIMNYGEEQSLLSYTIAFNKVQFQDEQIHITKETLIKNAPEGKAIHCFDRDANGKIKHANSERSLSQDRPVSSSYGGLTPESAFLESQFQLIKLYRDWNIGRHMITRKPQSIELPGDFLSEDMGNLALILNNLLGGGAEKALLDKLGLFYEGIERIRTKIDRGKVHISLYEKGLSQPIPATRLSDGMLHYLCLLALLVHPDPPPLIAIEEPEIGMHPDAIELIAELLVEASQHTQLIVTTHSDLLVSELSDVPESILVCEHKESGSEVKRLKKEDLDEWLEKYSLGDLWMKGEIGGVRR